MVAGKHVGIDLLSHLIKLLNLRKCLNIRPSFRSLTLQRISLWRIPLPLLSGTCSLPRWGFGEGESKGGKKWRHGGVMRRCGINRSWTDGAICGSVKPGSGKEARKKRQLSGADSAWLLVNSSWSQQAGKSLSDKVESFLRAPKEPALWGGQQAARSASQNG